MKSETPTTRGPGSILDAGHRALIRLTDRDRTVDTMTTRLAEPGYLLVAFDMESTIVVLSLIAIDIAVMAAAFAFGVTVHWAVPR